jgi:acyl-CoA reductase-like NAD-dependent aldehyde dehydrogenase
MAAQLSARHWIDGEWVDAPERAQSINPATGDETEEGGYKKSGIGRLNGVSALDDFLEYRTIIHEVDLT